MSPEFNRWRSILLFFLVLALPLVAASAPAQKSPVRITADSLALDQKEQSTTYIGNVVLTQGPMTLTADSLKVFVDNGKLGRIEASGDPARFETTLEDETLVKGEADRIVFDSANGLLTLIGDGRLSQGQNRIENDYIRYNLRNGNLKAGGEKARKRVEMIFHPEQ